MYAIIALAEFSETGIARYIAGIHLDLFWDFREIFK